MSICTAKTQDGGRCKARAIKGSEWCYNHHPDHSEERQRHASKGGKRGGRGRPAKAEHQGLREIKKLLSDLTAGVLTGEVERGTAIAASAASLTSTIVPSGASTQMHSKDCSNS